MAKTHTQYTRSNTPWSRMILIWLWSSQTIGSIIVTAFAAALVNRRKPLQHRADDGFADSMFQITAYLVFSFTVINAIFMIPTYMHYKRNSLSPMWMMIGSVWLAMFWIVGAAMAIWSMVWSAPTFEVYEVCDLLVVFAAVPYLAGLIYYSFVYHSWRTARRGDIETTNERYSLDSRKPFADGHAVSKH